LFIGELLRHAERYLAEGLHPRVLTDGFLLANKRVEAFIETFKLKKDILNHDFLASVARTSLRYFTLSLSSL
jgi:T-complex protein 1 subunit zeta